MPSLSWLTLLIFSPLIGVVAIFCIDAKRQNKHDNAKKIGLLTSTVTFIFALLIFSRFDPTNPDFQMIEHISWILSPQIDYMVGVDGISMMFVLLTALLVPLCILASWRSIEHNVQFYIVSFLILETCILGTFCALDIVLFYIFFEAVLIPMFLIIGIWGGPRRVYSAIKFFLYTLLGSIIMLIGIIVIYQQTGTTLIPKLMQHVFDPSWQMWLWVAFFVSFAVKMPMWPVHTWLPDAHVEAPTAGSMILAGILLKMGGYGFIRFLIPLFPDACHSFGPFVSTLSLIALIYTSLVALVQQDMKKLIAYSPVAHMGIVTFGAMSGQIQGLQGSIFQMLSHGVVSSALFMCIGVLYERMHTREIAQYGGVAKQMPVFATLFMIFTFASIGLPGTSGFVGEILVAISAFKISAFMAACIGLGTVLSAGYALNLYRRVMLGKLENQALMKLKDLSGIERATLSLLAILTLLLGISPQPVLNITYPAVEKTCRTYLSHGSNQHSKALISPSHGESF